MVPRGVLDEVFFSLFRLVVAQVQEQGRLAPRRPFEDNGQNLWSIIHTFIPSILALLFQRARISDTFQMNSLQLDHRHMIKDSGHGVQAMARIAGPGNGQAQVHGQGHGPGHGSCHGQGHAHGHGQGLGHGHGRGQCHCHVPSHGHVPGKGSSFHGRAATLFQTARVSNSSAALTAPTVGHLALQAGQSLQ